MREREREFGAAIVEEATWRAKLILHLLLQLGEGVEVPGMVAVGGVGCGSLLLLEHAAEGVAAAAKRARESQTGRDEHCERNFDSLSEAFIFVAQLDGGRRAGIEEASLLVEFCWNSGQLGDEGEGVLRMEASFDLPAPGTRLRAVMIEVSVTVAVVSSTLLQVLTQTPLSGSS